MRKINNNKFRNNNNNNGGNTIYSLNYKFDSVSVAGKFCGTALELIKKYNELAKEAHSNGNYVEMEVFRQYAEHYRKIVTEINERKNQNRENQQQAENNNENQTQQTEAENGAETVDEVAKENTVIEDKSSDKVETKDNKETEKEVAPRKKRRSFTIVEVAKEELNSTPEVTEENKPKVKRVGRGRPKLADKVKEPAGAEGASNA